MLKSVTAVGLIGSLLAATAVLATPAAAAAAAPEGVGIEVVSDNGSGCPFGQGSARLSATAASFTLVSISSYFAEVGDQAGTTAFQSNCHHSLRFTGAEGWMYAITRIAYTGYVLLPRGTFGLS